MDEVEINDEERMAAVEAKMRAAGVATEVSPQADYFGFSETHRVMLPDGVSFVTHQTLNEGARRKYLNDVNREVKLQKTTGDAIMKIQSGSERFSLLKAAIVGWNLQRGGQDVPFNPRNLEEFLTAANPRIVDLIEKDVRKANPWLMAEMTVEDIDKQIEELQEMRAVKLEEEEGKGS